MLIDVHAHAVLDAWRDRLAAASCGGLLVKDGMALPAWGADLAIEVMDAHGIDAMVLSAPSGAAIAGPTGEAALARAMNEEVAEVIARHPRRFGAFAVLPLHDIDAALAELAYADEQLGLDGAGLLTSHAGRYLGDAHFEPLFAELDRRRMPTFVHPDTPSFFPAIDLPFSSSILEFMFDTARTLTSLVYSGRRARYPNFPYIASHGGGVLPFIAQRIGMATTVMPTGYGTEMTPAEVAAVLKTFHFDLAAATTPVALTGLLTMTNTDKLLSGFDFPYMPGRTIAPAQAALAASPLLDDTARSAIASDNALTILPRLAARLGTTVAAA